MVEKGKRGQGTDEVTTNYSGNRLWSTPRDRENVLTLSEVNLIHIQRHIVKNSQVFKSGVAL